MYGYTVCQSLLCALFTDHRIGIPSEEFLNFLPPLPDASQPRPASPVPAPQEPVKMERPSSPLPQHVASATAADYATQVPYADSVLASAPSWHLPGPPPSLASSKMQSVRFPTPSPQQALLSAYHHILTHPISQVGPANPAKHKVAMALLAQIQSNSRWDAPSTLYGNVVPCPPRVSAIGPSYPVSISTLEDIKAGKEVDEKKPTLPPAPPRAVFSSDKLVFLASQQASRIPELARQVLPVCSRPSWSWLCINDPFRAPFWRVQRVSRTPLYCNGARKNSHTAPASARRGTRRRRVRLDRPPKVATRRWQRTKTHRHSRFRMLRCSRRGITKSSTIRMLCLAERAGWLASLIHRSARRLLESLKQATWVNVSQAREVESTHLGRSNAM